QIVSSTGALTLPKVPKTMVVIGGGVIGLELGTVWRRLGAEVTVIEYLDRILPTMDVDLGKNTQRVLTKQGMKFKLGAKVTAAKKAKSGVTLTVEPAKGGTPEEIAADVVLV
ncbi:FAD-dependent oxidoreductase, partial [Acinetobacter baumannii]